MPDRIFTLPEYEPTSTSATPDPKEVASGVTKAFSQIPAGFHSELASAVHAVKNITGLADKAARHLSERTGWDIHKSMDHIQDVLSDFESAESRRAERYGAPSGPLGAAMRIAGAAPVQLGEYAASYAVTRRPTAAFALVDAAKELDKGALAAAKAGAIGAATGYGLSKLSKLPLKSRIPGGAAVNAAATALQGGSPSDVATSAIAGGAFAAIPEPRKPSAVPPQSFQQKLQAMPSNVRSKIDTVTQGPKKGLDELRKVFTPASRGAEPKEASLIFREHNARLDLQTKIAEQRARQAWDFFRTTPKADNHLFMANMDHGGNRAAIPQDQQAFASTIESILTDARDELAKRGLLKGWYQNYFPHSGWKDPNKAKTLAADLLSRRPMAGRKGYSRHRTYITFQDALNAGLEPAYDNPVDMVFSKLREINKSIAFHDTMAEMEQKGLAKRVKLGTGKKLPPGLSDWVPLGRNANDTSFLVYGPPRRKVTVKTPQGKVTKTVGTGGLNIVQQWYAPKQVADLVHNYLAPGLQGNTVYDAIRATGNVMNQWQLGFSAFHLGFTGIDSMTSNFATALHYLSRGKPLEAAKTIAETPISPFRYYTRGSKVLQEGLNPGKYGGQIADIVDKAVKGGARFGQDKFYRTALSDQIKEAFAKGDIGRAIFRSAFLPGDYMSDLIMGKLVPRMKLGAIAQLLEMEAKTNGVNWGPDQWRAAAARISDSIDNRMGQVVYDNWFMNRFAKDALMISMRSVGWNVGTFKEILGGAKDIAKLASRRPELTYRAAYLAALPTVIGAMGALTQVMLGQGWPKEIKDYFFPRTGALDEHGDAERISFPSYMKDMFNYIHEPVGTITNKAHPLLGTISEMLSNKDFYGDQIANHTDPAMVQWLDRAKFAASEFVPFSVRYFAQERGRSSGPLGEAGPFIGITPAGRSIVQSPAERLASDLARQKQPIGGRPKQQAEKNQLIRNVESEMRRNSPEAAQDFREAIQGGGLGRRDLRNMLRAERSPSLVNTVNTLSLDEALTVWHEASPDERKAILPVILKKVRGLKQMPPKDAKRLIERLRTEVLNYKPEPEQPRQFTIPEYEAQ